VFKIIDDGDRTTVLGHAYCMTYVTTVCHHVESGRVTVNGKDDGPWRL
jgi:hypothetical protein